MILEEGLCAKCGELVIREPGEEWAAPLGETVCFGGFHYVRDADLERRQVGEEAEFSLAAVAAGTATAALTVEIVLTGKKGDVLWRQMLPAVAGAAWTERIVPGNEIRVAGIQVAVH